MKKLLIILLFIACNGVENDCNGNGYNWECECVGILEEELEEPLLGEETDTWFHCCNTDQDSCWYRILE